MSGFGRTGLGRFRIRRATRDAGRITPIHARQAVCLTRLFARSLASNPLCFGLPQGIGYASRLDLSLRRHGGPALLDRPRDFFLAAGSSQPLHFLGRTPRLGDALLLGASLLGASSRGALLCSSYVRSSRFRGPCFCRACLGSANFGGACFCGTCLLGTYFSCAHFRRACLFCACFCGSAPSLCGLGISHSVLCRWRRGPGCPALSAGDRSRRGDLANLCFCPRPLLLGPPRIRLGPGAPEHVRLVRLALCGISTGSLVLSFGLLSSLPPLLRLVGVACKPVRDGVAGIVGAANCR